MKSALRLALVAFPFVTLSCASDPPAPREPVVPVASTPPGRPNPVPSNPGPAAPPTVGGSSGSPGTGGTGGSTRPPDGGRRPDAPGGDTAPAVPACAMTVTAMGNTGLIDDFQDNNVNVLMNDGRVGSWKIKQSLTAMTNAMAGTPTVVQTGGQGTPPRALRLQGSEPDALGQYGAEAEVVLVADETGGCYDASAYRGVQLALKGQAGTSVYVMLLTGSVRAQNTPDQIGGHYRFKVNFTNSNQFQNLMILWDQFEAGWGTTPGPDVDPKLVYGLSIVTAQRPATNDAGAAVIGAFDFTVDNVRFIQQ